MTELSQRTLLERLSDANDRIRELQADLKAERGETPAGGITVFRHGLKPTADVKTLAIRLSLDLLEASRHPSAYLDEIMATMRAEIERETKARAERKSAG